MKNSFEKIKTIRSLRRNPKNKCFGPTSSGFLLGEQIEGITNFGICEGSLEGDYNAIDTQLRSGAFLEVFDYSLQLVFADVIAWVWCHELQIFHPKGLSSLAWVTMAFDDGLFFGRITMPGVKKTV